MKKRFWATLLTLAMLLALCPATVFAARGTLTVNDSTGGSTTYPDGQDVVITGTGSHTVTVTDLWKGTITCNEGTTTISGSGTINGSGKNKSVITVNKGATVVLEGDVTITGGTGTVSNRTDFNYAEGDWETGESIGGGVLVWEGATLIMNGGTITGNKAGMGGGIYIHQIFNGTSSVGRFEMTGGTISNNTATNSEGGGIYCFGEAVITGGQITGNQTQTTYDVGGGGIFVASQSSMRIRNAVISGNTAEGLGGGVMNCFTSSTIISDTDGAAIYGNTAKGAAHISRTGSNSDTIRERLELYSISNRQDIQSCAQDIYSMTGFAVGEYRLGGGTAAWEGIQANANGSSTQISPGSGPVINKPYDTNATDEAQCVALTAGNVSSPSIPANTVLISGNKSAMHGGGIAVGGTLTIGDVTSNQTYRTLDGNLTLSINVALAGSSLQPSLSGYVFELLDSGNVLDTATSDASGNATLSYGNGIDSSTLASVNNYTFYVRQKAGSNPNIIYDTTAHRVEATVQSSRTEAIDLGGTTISIKYYQPTSLTVDGNSWNAADSITFTNVWKTGSLTLTNTVNVDEGSDQPDANQQFTFRVQLGNGSTAQSGNTWVGEGVYTFILKDNESATITGIPFGTTYTVTEDPIGAGWTISSLTGNKGTISDGTHIVTFTNDYNNAKTNVSVEVVFDGGDEYTPDSITVALMRNGTSYQTATLTESGGWRYTWADLPLTVGGETYIYNVKLTSATSSTASGYHADARVGNIIRVRSNVTAAEGGNEILGGWVVNESSVTNGRATIQNTWRGAEEQGTGSFEVTAVDSESMEPIAGVAFTLDDPRDYRTMVTDASGSATFSGLTAGIYTLTESSAPAAYQTEVNVGRTWTVNVTKDQLMSVQTTDSSYSVGRNTWAYKADCGGQPSPLSIANDPIKGSISITPVIDQNEYINQADFSNQIYTYHVKDASGADIGTLTAKPGETATLNDLRYGSYTITADETAVPGYTWLGVSFGGGTPSKTGTTTVNVAENGLTYSLAAVNTYAPESAQAAAITPASVSVSSGTANPTVTITSSIDFGPNATNTGSYRVEPGTTGLRLESVGSVTRAVDPRSVTLRFSGTAAPGTLTLAVTQGAYNVPIGNQPTISITVPAPAPDNSGGSSSGGGGGGGGGGSRDRDDTPPTTQPVKIPETVPSPVQEDIIKDDEEKHPDWVDRLELPDYAKTLYNVMSGRPIQSGVTNKPERESVFRPEENFDLGQQGVPGSADVEFVEEVNFDLRDMYAMENEENDETGKKEVRSTIFEDEKFYTISVSDTDKRVNYSALQQGDVVRTAKFNGLYVTKIVRDNNYDTAKKEACEYVAAVYQAFDRDCPEIFWLSGKCKVRIMTVKSGGSQEAYFFLVLADDSGFTMRSPEWQADGAITAGVQRRDEAITKILETVTSGEVVGQVKQLNQWLTENNQYNTTPDLATISNEPHECLSALEGRIDQNGPVCDGYSRAFKVLCDRLDIPCVLETGWAQATAASTPEFHMWCNVQVAEIWYGVDITWDDPSVKGFVGAKSGRENENFLLVGANTVVLGREFQASHIVKNQACVGGVDFNNGPVLSPIAFAPVAYSGGYYVALFDDVPVTHWAAEAVAWAKSMGYMAGTSGVTFSPDSLVTREQVWIVLARVAGEPFTSYEGIRQWAINAGITDGSNSQAPASRQQALTFLYLCAKLKGFSLTQSAQLSAYLDASQVAPWAEEAMEWAVGSGLVSGTTPTTLSPEGTTTRAQFALILQNFFKNVHVGR